MKNENLPSLPVREGALLPVFSPDGFNHYQRIATVLSSSNIVPEIYRGKQGIANCLVALELSTRMQLSPWLVMQNLDIIHGRPAWRAQFKIGLVSGNPRFGNLKYEFKEDGKNMVVEYVFYSGKKGTPSWKKNVGKINLQANVKCRAWTKDEDGENIYGPWISFKMAIEEGWWTRSGSKWPSMGQKMLMYRAGAWFIDVYSPESAMGIRTVEEEQEIGYVEIGNEPLTKVKELNSIYNNAAETAETADEVDDGGAGESVTDGDGYENPDDMDTDDGDNDEFIE